jgi:low temperature requirement protein LtrA
MDEAGKRISRVELYLDLVFVLAVGQLAHLVVAHPAMRSVWIAVRPSAAVGPPADTRR